MIGGIGKQSAYSAPSTDCESGGYILIVSIDVTCIYTRYFLVEITIPSLYKKFWKPLNNFLSHLIHLNMVVFLFRNNKKKNSSSLELAYTWWGWKGWK